MALAQPEIKLSPTVKRTRDRFADYESIFALDIIREILSLHSGDYAKGHDREGLSDGPESNRMHVDNWLHKVSDLFDKNSAPELHGRIAILGLGLVDLELGKNLKKTGLFTAIRSELTKPFELLLNENGNSLLKQLDQMPIIDPAPIDGLNTGDSVDTVSDRAVQRKEDDLLGRAVYAEYIAKRLKAISKEESSQNVGLAENKKSTKSNDKDEDNSFYAKAISWLSRILKGQDNELSGSEQAFAIHVYGPWGSGKSTLLNFLRQELEQGEEVKQDEKLEQGWLVVEFNAWRNQNIKPPWWALMECVFNSARRGGHLTNWDIVREYWWRLRMGRAHYYLIAFIVICLIGYGILKKGGIFSSLGEWSDVADSFTLFLTAMAGLWTAVQGLSKTALTGSTKGAESYMQFVSEPMESMAKHFAKLIERIATAEIREGNSDGKGSIKRVAIFVDDLDRCDAKYVVELLEGFQTLFRSKMVFFIVAADQKWLNASFEEVYEKLRPHVQEPAKSLGTLFLEKVFQFTVPMPGIRKYAKEEFWTYHLIDKNTEEWESERAKAKKAAAEKMANVKSDEDIDAVVNDSEPDSLERTMISERAMIYLATPKVAEDIETHTLAPYAPLLEPNPRSMKRLINAYSVNRALALNGQLKLDKDEIAAWTIIEMRWPEIAEYLRGEPKNIEEIISDEKLEKNSPLAKLPEDIRKDSKDQLKSAEKTKPDKEFKKNSPLTKLPEDVRKDLKEVVNGVEEGGLNVNVIEECAKLRM